ncbi:O-antigen polymerase [Paenibacillus algicola]|uniref:O-antigen polymerase n=1 Tax=Paenibacillus algicola TaxID=2565926 RepID=A0A4P8XTZ7_9BACL|nr:O-antigen ligase family protein [Paenibacillus algicola]QCT04239.1 O-antigen polymerase [Paenibacillus algicola]
MVTGILGILLLTMLGMGCLQTGLFFDHEMYGVAAVTGGLCLAASAVLAVRPAAEGSKVLAAGDEAGLAAGQAAIRNHPSTVIMRSAVMPLLLLSIMMTAAYGFHLISGPVSVQGTQREMTHWSLCAAAGLTAWRLSRTEGGRSWLRLAWHGTGAVLCGSALLAVYGVLELPDAILRTADPAISAAGARLGGLLQYPNTFGAVMAAFLLERLFALPGALQRRTGLGREAAALLPLLPYAAALLLTESRGAWLAAALAAAAGLAAERRGAALLLAAAAAPFAGAALLYRQLAEAQLAPAVLPGLLWLAGLWAGGSIAGRWLACGLLRSQPAGAAPPRAHLAPPRVRLASSRAHLAPPRVRLASSRVRLAPPRAHLAPPRARLALLASLLLYAVAAVAIGSQIHTRLDPQGGTMASRLFMYRDAWQLFQQSPWFGQGGDTWRTYSFLQSQPYAAAEVHSGYLDWLLNLGLISAAGVALLLWTLCRAVSVSRQAAQWTPLLALLIHSAVDFDWSYGLVWLIIILLAANGETSRPSAAQASPDPRSRPPR